MIRSAIEHLDVHTCACPACESLEEIVHKFSLQVADKTHANFRIHLRRCAPAEINCCKPQCLIHRHQEITGAQNAALGAKRLVKELTQHDADVLNRVVLVDVKVALRTQLKIESTMVRKQFKHVIEESHASRNLLTTLSVDEERGADIGFLSLTVD